MQICHELSCKHGLSSSLPALEERLLSTTPKLTTSKFSAIFCATLCFLQAYAILSEAKYEHTRKRKFLLSLYNDAEHRLKNMDHNILSLLQTKVGNIEEEMKRHKLQLACEEYILLVAGI